MKNVSSPESLIEEILQLINSSMRNLEYIGAMQWILGFLQKDAPVQTALAARLTQEQIKYLEFYRLVKQAKKEGKNIRVSGLSDHVKVFQEGLWRTQETKDIYKNRFVKVLCSDQKIIKIAEEIIEKGSVSFLKTEVEEIFEFSTIIDWRRIPDYAIIYLGGGIRLSLPEVELFEIMTQCYDQAHISHQKMIEYKKEIFSSEDVIDNYLKVARESSLCSIQVVIHAFLLLEAFINSIAYVSLASKTKDFTENERLYLSEQSKDKSGKLIQRFVSIENKLCDWVKLISPTGQTFDKGRSPFQDFKKLKLYRDSVVHLSGQKVGHFRSIDFNIAVKSIETTLEMIKKVCEYISPDDNNIEYPFWLIEPGEDGLFHFSPEIEIGLDASI